MPQLDGPSLPPLAGGPPRQLVVLLHGYGADGNDLLPLATAWREAMPNAAFRLPNAPSPCPGVPGGRQWFPLTSMTLAEIGEGVEAVAPTVSAYLDKTLAELGLDDGALALAGFSQGGMIALHVGLRRPHPIAAILSMSGVLAAAPPTRDDGFPPVMLTHGGGDPLVPPAAMAAAEHALRASGIVVEAMVRPGLGHGIDPAQAERGGKFLAEALAEAANAVP